MPERDGYQAGVPCWVNVALPDPAAGVRFYSELFGWEFEDRMPPEAPGRYFIAKLRGREVAAVGSQPEDAGDLAYWSTYICVDDADETAAKVRAAGGQVLDEPFDVFDAGRMAVCVDPGGAVFCIWQPRRHRGAQLVNEPGAWNWSELNTRDPEAVKAFYGEVFGWETAAFDLGDGDSYTIWRVPGYDPGDRGDVDAPDDVIGGLTPMIPETFPDDVPSHWGVAFVVDDVDATVAQATELGGQVAMPPFDAGVVRIAVLMDPQGAVFSVNQLTG